jgi:hypothetical protein
VIQIASFKTSRVSHRSDRLALLSLYTATDKTAGGSGGFVVKRSTFGHNTIGSQRLVVLMLQYAFE